MNEQGFVTLSTKLSLIRFFGFSLRPFSLGVAVRYMRHRKHWDQFYLQENEKELLMFLDYILDYNLLAGKFLRDNHKLSYNLANEILHRETTEEILNQNEWRMILLYLHYIEFKKDETLVDIVKIHPEGNHICHYLRFIVLQDEESKKYLSY